MLRFSRLLALAAMMFLLARLFSACSGSTDSATGSVDADVTDAPALDYAHVYVTVTKLAFHLNAGAGNNTAGWQTLTLQAPVTIDLAQLTSGKVYGDVAGGKSLFSGVVLPVGKYQQIRIFLASSENPYVGSVAGLQYNNEVQLKNDATHYALRIPSPGEGIRLIPESPVVVTAGGNAKLVLDFNLNNDVVKVSPNGQTEYILKPRLGYFDMNQVGAVTGTVSISTPTAFSNLSTSRFVIKAEQLKDPKDPANTSGKNYRIVRRLTSVDKTTGAFKLSPLPVFGNATTASYDILLRGLKFQTAIVKGVKVHKGGSVNLGTLTMTPGSDYTAQLANVMHPSGAWMNFYQTITGDPVPFEVRYRHLNPYTGLLWQPIELSADQIQVYTFNNATGSLGSSAASPANGAFTAIADAGGPYGRGASMAVNGTASQVVQMSNLVTHAPQVLSPAVAKSITATVTIPAALMATPPLSKGHLFVTHGGLVIDSYQVDSLITSGGGLSNPFTVSNLPGGTAAAPLPGAYYGMYIQAWGGGKRASGSQQHIDLTTGDATVAVTMQ